MINYIICLILSAELVIPGFKFSATSTMHSNDLKKLYEKLLKLRRHSKTGDH